jgi:hypothetical protein
VPAVSGIERAAEKTDARHHLQLACAPKAA